MSETSGANATFLDRTLARFGDVWRDFLGASRRPGAAGWTPTLPDPEVGRMRAEMRACIDSGGDEVSARTRAAELGSAYLGLNEVGRRRFLLILARDFDVSESDIDDAIVARQHAQGPDSRRQAERALREALTARRIILLRQFNSLPQGVKFLVDLRAELIGWLPDEPELSPLEDDLKSLLASWFDVGLLELRRITWSSPAALLEKLSIYEAVHEIRSWSDLKNRLDLDRRCFAFFHPCMPEEPLIFVEIALVNELSENIQSLLDETAPVLDPRRATTAIFYSISNAQKGLSGISFGNVLIKNVVAEIQRELPNLRIFATLSPLPGFLTWLRRSLELRAENIPVSEDEAEQVRALLTTESDALVAPTPDVRGLLLRLGAHYLLREKKNGRARDPVAHFHLSNGARLERLNWLADVSPRGLRASAGLMVNYLYKLAEFGNNHAAYVQRGRIPCATQVRNLLKK